MPIEREFKYVLENAEHLEDLIRQDSDSIVEVIQVNQYYLNENARARQKQVEKKDHEGKICLDTTLVFTYKHKLEAGSGRLEIETKLTNEDFSIIKKEANVSLSKTRYVLQHKSGIWEIDFFKNLGKTYFVLAEYEDRDGLGEPKNLHPFVEKYLIHKVAEGDSRFDSYKIASIEHALNIVGSFESNGSKAKSAS